MTERDEAMRLAATMYYLQDEPMEAIARSLGTSRSTVSRLLKDARSSGLVRIVVRTESDTAGLAEAFRTTYGVQVHTARVRPGASDRERLGQVAKVAARLLADWVGDDTVLGVAWGTTVSAVARHLASTPTRGSTVVQLNGAANTHTSGLEYAGSIIAAFGAAFEAEVLHFPVPAFFDFAETKAAMWRERSVRRVLELQHRTDVALFGVGTFAGDVPSHVYAAGYLDDGDLRTLTAAGVVGDVCTVFLREDGSYRDIEINKRSTGPTPHELALLPRRVCVVAGEAKIRPLAAAIRARAMTDLVVEETTARRLLSGAAPSVR